MSLLAQKSTCTDAVTRLLTAAVGIPLVALAVWIGGGLLAGVVAVAVLIAVVEILAAHGAATGGSWRSLPVLSSAVLGAILPVAALAGQEWLIGAIALAIIVPSTLFTLTHDPHVAVNDWLWGIASSLYIGVLAAHFVLLRERDAGRDWVFFTVLTVWTTDTGAYAVGKLIGKHKMSPIISPGKTVEGGIGSLVTGFIAVFVLAAALGLDLSLAHRIVLGLLLPPVITFGDLAESALKRALDVKDSGVIIPGHGGMADRIDSLLFAAPVVFYYLLAFKL